MTNTVVVFRDERGTVLWEDRPKRRHRVLNKGGYVYRDGQAYCVVSMRVDEYSNGSARLRAIYANYVVREIGK